MMEEKLPKGWKLLPLKDLNQRKSKNIDPSKHPEITFELYSVPQFEFSKPEYLKGREIKSTKQKVSAGEVLISKINPRINRVWKVEGFSDYEKIASSEWIIIKPKSFVDSDYLRYACSAPFFRTLLQSEVSGVGGSLTRARPKIVENYKLPIAPLPEQQRIVAKLDALFGHLDSLREKLDGIPVLLKNFRQQVLTQAVTGELTKEWREGKGLGEWEETTIGNLFEVKTGGTPRRGVKEYYEGGTIPWVKSGLVKNELIFEADEFITEIAIRDSNVKIFPVDTLLVAMYGEGKTRGQVGWLKIEATTNQAIAALVNETMPTITRTYVFYYCLSQYNDIRAKAEGGNQPNLNLSKVKNWDISMPPLEEQKEIVSQVDALFSLADKIESQYASLKAKIDQLPQAILAKAFRGELVSQEVKEYVVEEIEGLMAAEPKKGYGSE